VACVDIEEDKGYNFLVLNVIDNTFLQRSWWRLGWAVCGYLICTLDWLSYWGMTIRINGNWCVKWYWPLLADTFGFKLAISQLKTALAW